MSLDALCLTKAQYTFNYNFLKELSLKYDQFYIWKIYLRIKNHINLFFSNIFSKSHAITSKTFADSLSLQYMRNGKNKGTGSTANVSG